MATKRIKVLRNVPVPEKEIARGEAPEGGARETENPASSTHAPGFAPGFESILRETIDPRHFVPPSITREVVIEYDFRDMSYTVRIPELGMLVPREVVEQLRYARSGFDSRSGLVDYIMSILQEFVASAVSRMDRL